MKTRRTPILFAATLIGALALATTAQAEDIDTRIGKLSFTHDFANGYPTSETVAKLYDERDFQRACQVYLWALPMVHNGALKAIIQSPPGAKDGDLLLAESYDDKRLMLTPNATTPYILSWVHLEKRGPFVIEVPPGPTADLVNDLWQRPVTDMGQAGPDQARGGKYLLLGPGQEPPTGVEGYFMVRSSTFNNMIAFRLLAQDEAERRQQLDAIRMYPFTERNNPPKSKVAPPAKDAIFNRAPRGLAYWEMLAELVNQEPVQERDRIMMAMLRSLGIEKGKPFKPDEQQARILTEAALVGEAMAKANDFDKRNMELAHYADGVQWHFALVLDVFQEAEHYTQLDERAAWFYEAGGTSKGMAGKTPGVGQVYLSTYKDSAGDWLDGAKTYRLRVPANAPVKQFWSLTVYDVDTRALVQNKEKIADRSSVQDLVKNADGSVDVYVGPKAPRGFEKNWIPSVPGKAWFPYFRLYGPTEAHFNGTWVLSDFERIK